MRIVPKDILAKHESVLAKQAPKTGELKRYQPHEIHFTRELKGVVRRAKLAKREKPRLHGDVRQLAGGGEKEGLILYLSGLAAGWDQNVPVR